MTPPRPARSRTAAGLAASIALVAGGVVASALPAHADEPVPQCTDTFPTSSLDPEMTASVYTTVKGRNVTKLDATYVDTLEDGIGRGRDLLLFRISGDPVDRTGIWQGMSGSPVVASDGRLIGALAYGFNDGDDTLAGITPADDLKSVKSWQAPDTVSMQSARPALKREGVTTSASDRLHKVGLVRQVSGLSASDLPLAKRLAKRAGMDPTGLEAGGAAGSEAPEYGILAGLPVAASYSYGDVTLAATGTATALCGDDVYAFGHPDEFLGDTEQSMHGASVASISRGTRTSYVLANLGRPVGTMLQDRLEGLYGRVGALPSVHVDLSSTTTYPNRPDTAGRTTITEAPAAPYVVAMQVASDLVTATNTGDAGGESLVSWTIDYVRENGTAGTFTRTQRYSSPEGLADEVVSDVAGDVDLLQNNPFEDVRITKVDVTNGLTKAYRAATITSVDQKIGSSYRRLKNGGTISGKRGQRITLRLNLARSDRWSAVAPSSLFVTYDTSKAWNRSGRLTVVGNAYGLDDEDWDDEDFEGMPIGFAGATTAKNLDQLLAAVKKLPRQDDVTSSLAYSVTRGGKKGTSVKTSRATSIVEGRYTFRVALS